jgi:hypothetical protein
MGDLTSDAELVPYSPRLAVRKIRTISSGDGLRPKERNIIYPEVDFLVFSPVECVSGNPGIAMYQTKTRVPFDESDDRQSNSPNFERIDRQNKAGKFTAAFNQDTPFVFFDPQTNEISPAERSEIDWEKYQRQNPLSLFVADLNKQDRVTHTMGRNMLVFHTGENSSSGGLGKIKALMTRHSLKTLTGLLTYASALIPYADQFPRISGKIEPETTRQKLSVHFETDRELEKPFVSARYLSELCNRINLSRSLGGVYI